MVKEKISQIEKKLQKTKEDLDELEIYIEDFSLFLPLAVCAVSPLGIILNINKALEDLSGFSPLEIVGESLEVIFYQKKEIKELEKEILKRGIIKYKELTLLSKAGKRVSVSISASIRKDRGGDFIGFFLAIADITEIKKYRKELEGKVQERTKELREKIEELENARKALTNMLEDVEDARLKAEEESNKTITIINHFVDGLLVFDKENQLSLVNPQAEGLFDIKGRDLIKRTFSELNTFPTIAPLIKLLGDEQKRVFRKELPLAKKITLEVTTVPLAQEGEGKGTLVILHDITREKTVEEMKTEFVSLAAHQLRTPLSAVKWTLKMLLDGDLGAITEDQKTFVEKSYLSNERMISLINDLLDVTRIEEGRYLYRPALANIEELARSAVDSYKEEAARKGLKIEFRGFPREAPKVRVDVEKVKIVFQNLLDNAIKYNKPEGKVTISLNYDKKEVAFSIKDTGVGIPADQQERVFVKFFRGINVKRMDTEGSGLGLFIAKNIIEAHGGRIWFESVEGQGTTFYFTLPVKTEFEEFLKEF